MAKEKKRGFFSWLGFGQKEQAQETETEQKVEEQQAVADETPVAETPAEPSAPKADPEAFAEDVVEVTETVVESEKSAPRGACQRARKRVGGNACSGRRRACC